jgi:hypothetical protein
MFILVVLVAAAVVLACVGLGLAELARPRSTAPADASVEPHRGALAVLLVGIGVVVFAPVVAVFWPNPDIPGGWCGSGADHDGYTVVTVTQLALAASLIAAPIVVAAAAMLPRTRSERVAVAILTALGAAFSVLVVLVMLGYEVGCGGS